MITYVDSAKGIDADQLQGFFVGWPAPPGSEKHRELLRNSSHIVLAMDDETDKVVGFITALCDGVLAAYIPLLEVLPDYQGRGIGSELMRRMLEKLRGLYAIDLVCDPDLQSFYARFGMQPYNAMIIRHRRR